MIKKTILGAILLFAGNAAQAQTILIPPGNDPGGYYSQFDHDGFYDHDGNYHHIRHRGFDGPPPRDRDYGPPPGDRDYATPPPPPPQSYYEQGRYENDCHRGNAAAGTIFGAIAGGLIGGGVSHGNGGAVVGGAVLGGLLGNTISRDVDCDDQPYAFRVYADGLNGPVGTRSEWHHNNAYGYFTPMREFRRNGTVCRDFTETSYRGGQSFTRTGTACRSPSGDWRFD